MKILLLAGGWSAEREISLVGAEQILKALKRLGHEVSLLDPLISMGEIIAKGKDFDFVFINMHGAPGEDGLIQAVIEKLQIPFNGSGSAASIIALNKYLTKIYYRSASLSVCDDFLLTFSNRDNVKLDFPFPIIMKPNNGGSSLRLEILKNEDELKKAVEAKVHSDRDEYILEPLINGMELTCPALGNNSGLLALPPVLIKPAAGPLFDFTAKYADGGAEEICPAPIDSNILDEIRAMALKAHEILGLSGYSRTDFIVTDDGSIFLLESNTLPGMTPNSLLPKSAKVHGLSFEELIEEIILLGLARFEEKRH